VLEKIKGLNAKDGDVVMEDQGDAMEVDAESTTSGTKRPPVHPFKLLLALEVYKNCK